MFDRSSGLWICLFAASAVGLFALPCSAQAHVVSSDNEWAPYFYENEDGERVGFLRELYQKCIPSTGYELRFVDMPVRRRDLMIRSGELDFMLFSLRPDRLEYLEFGSEAVLKDSYRPVVLKGSGIKIESMKDFDSLRIGLLGGLTVSDAFQEYLSKAKAEGRLDQTSSNIANLRKLINGSVDVIINMSSTIQFNAMRLDALDQIQFLDFYLQTKSYYLVVSKDSKRIADREAFLKRFDTCLKAMKADGSYEDLYIKYFGSAPTDN